MNLRKLKATQIGVIVLDEAHHLRNEWWQCLTDIEKHFFERRGEMTETGHENQMLNVAITYCVE